MTSPMFWTDAQQAAERLTNTFVLYGDSPAYIDEVRPSARSVLASIRLYPESNIVEKDLSDPLFHRFRKLPATGWMNSIGTGQAMYTERRPTRTRLHGMSRINTRCASVNFDESRLSWGDYSYETLIKDPGGKACCVNDFPTLGQVFDSLGERNAAAISRKYAVIRDHNGLRWLFRNTDRIGLFTDADSLMVFAAYKYLKEEITEDPVISVRNIQEF